MALLTPTTTKKTYTEYLDRVDTAMTRLSQLNQNGHVWPDENPVWDPEDQEDVDYWLEYMKPVNLGELKYDGKHPIIYAARHEDWLPRTDERGELIQYVLMFEVGFTGHFTVLDLGAGKILPGMYHDHDFVLDPMAGERVLFTI